MLKSAADYHIQPTGNYDVTQTPIFARASAVGAPLRYEDWLYLNEARCAVESRFGTLAGSTIDYGDGLPISASGIASVVNGIVSRYASERSNCLQSESLRYVSPSGALPSGIYASDYLTNSAVLSAMRLPELTAADTPSAPSAGDAITAGQIVKPWNVLTRLRRVLVSYLYGGYPSGTYTEVVTDASGEETRRTGDATSFEAVYNVSYSGSIQNYSTVTAKTLAKPATVSGYDISHIVWRVGGYHKPTRTGQVDATPLWEVEDCEGETVTRSTALDASSAAAYANKLGIDTGAEYGWHVQKEALYLDVGINYLFAL